MDKKKQLVFKFFDTIYSGYKKHGRRTIDMSSPNVLFEYKNGEGRVAFSYNTEWDIINFQYTDFYTAVNMLGISISDMSDICREYVADKFNNPSASNSTFYPRNIK